MLHVKTGNSVNASAAAAGKEAALQVKDAIKDMKMAFVYSGVQYDQKEFLDAISAELPGVPLIGNTSFTGVITPEGYISSDGGFAGIMTLSDAALTVGVAGMPKQDGDPRKTGTAVAKEAMEKAGRSTAPNYFYMVAPPGEEECYLKGIEDVIGRIPFFGGSAADNAIAGEWELYTDEMVCADGVAVAFFYTDKPFANKFTGAYEETTNVGVITKLDGPRKLVEIDGVPAIRKYAEWTGHDMESLMLGNLLVTTITAPLGVKDRLGDLVAIRHPMNGNNDYSMDVGNNLAVGTAVIQMSGSVDQLINSVGETLEELKKKINGPIGALHLVHCGGRRAGIDSRIDEVTQQIKKSVGDIPFIVEFTFGEYGYEDDGNNTCGGLMLSFTAFGK
ncbi:MAG: FIST N-terminal domain-containing protein [Bacillota bacterium]|nr:FIST N-terminal domain-containing protein [Bacillota bacterium]